MSNLKENIFNYDLYIFDCDGVILDSNSLKAEAFYKSILEFGEEKAKEFLQYHKLHGGVSRYDKFKYFFDKIHKREDVNLNFYIKKYKSLIIDGYFNSNITEGFFEFIEKLKDKECYIVSGSDEKELKEVLEYKKIDKYFRAIYGSPKNKVENIKDYINYKNKKVLFIGDSQTDLEASKYFNFDFLFISGYCEIDLEANFKVKNFKNLF